MCSGDASGGGVGGDKSSEEGHREKCWRWGGVGGGLGESFSQGRWLFELIVWTCEWQRPDDEAKWRESKKEEQSQKSKKEEQSQEEGWTLGRQREAIFRGNSRYFRSTHTLSLSLFDKGTPCLSIRVYELLNTGLNCYTWTRIGCQNKPTICKLTWNWMANGVGHLDWGICCVNLALVLFGCKRVLGLKGPFWLLLFFLK